MNRRTPQIPSYRLHRASGQGVVTLSGRDHYLGAHDTPESRSKYGRLINEWLAQDQVSPIQNDVHGPEAISVAALIVGFWSHAERYYRKNGQPTGEIQALRYSLRPLQMMYGGDTVDQFGPKKLKAVRQQMINEDLARTLINKRVNRIRHVFKWGVENELVPSSILDGLKAVSPLKKGRTDAKESKPVKPVPSELIEGLKGFVSPQVWTMVQLQLRTAMRPGEVVQMGYTRRNFLVPLPSVRSFDELNDLLDQGCLAELTRQLRGKDGTKHQRLEEERAHFRGLPRDEFAACRVELRQANTLSLVRFDRNNYSVPVRWAHHQVTVVGDCDKVRMMCRDEVVATHSRDWGREQVRYDPIHYLALLERRPGAVDFAAPLEHWQLPPCFGILRRKLEADWPPSPGSKHRPRGY